MVFPTPDPAAVRRRLRDFLPATALIFILTDFRVVVLIAVATVAIDVAAVGAEELLLFDADSCETMEAAEASEAVFVEDDISMLVDDGVGE